VFKELIWVKENSLTKQFCKGVIDKFETDPHRKPGEVDQNNPRIDKDLKITIDVTITHNISWREEDEVLYKALGKGLYEYEIYLQKISSGKWNLHPSDGYRVKDTGYMIQKYEPNGFYMNTVKEEDGGWTEFVDGTKIQPKVGSILLFPATWTYVHRGYTTKVPKYIVTGWIYARP